MYVSVCMYVRLSRYQCMYVRLSLCQINSYIHTLYGQSIWGGYVMGLGTDYGVASISRLLKKIGLFCRISSLLQGSFAKETYHFMEPTNRSHPIPVYVCKS